MDEEIEHGTVAIMQPYIFPYIGYFHLIEASDIFVFYDDVNYIKRGWINRNRILLQGNPSTFTIPISRASQNVLIKDTHTCIDEKWCRNFYSLVGHAYRRAPFYSDVSDLLHAVIDNKNSRISDLSINSIASVYDYLGETFTFSKSSEISKNTRELGRGERLCKITQQIGCTSYVNASSGKSLYSKPRFKKYGVDLSFVSSKNISYKQFGQDFVPWLSMIDVLMFNSKEATREMLKEYTIT